MTAPGTARGTGSVVNAEIVVAEGASAATAAAAARAKRPAPRARRASNASNAASAKTGRWVPNRAPTASPKAAWKATAKHVNRGAKAATTAATTVVVARARNAAHAPKKAAHRRQWGLPIHIRKPMRWTRSIRS